MTKRATQTSRASDDTDDDGVDTYGTCDWLLRMDIATIQSQLSYKEHCVCIGLVDDGMRCLRKSELSTDSSDCAQTVLYFLLSISLITKALSDKHLISVESHLRLD